MLTVMDDQTIATFADYVKAIRAHAGMSQHDLAKRLSTTVSTISRWENGHYVPRSRLILEAITRLGRKHGLGPIPKH